MHVFCVGTRFLLLGLISMPFAPAYQYRENLFWLWVTHKLSSSNVPCAFVWIKVWRFWGPGQHVNFIFLFTNAVWVPSFNLLENTPLNDVYEWHRNRVNHLMWIFAVRIQRSCTMDFHAFCICLSVQRGWSGCGWRRSCRPTMSHAYLFG